MCVWGGAFLLILIRRFVESEVSQASGFMVSNVLTAEGRGGGRVRAQLLGAPSSGPAAVHISNPSQSILWMGIAVSLLRHVGSGDLFLDLFDGALRSS